MKETFDHILLTEREAAAILQPHMRNKSALHWLQNDRLHEPAIPFYFLQGQIYYLEPDLLPFINRALNPAARFIRIDNRIRNENRSTSERRNRLDRRINAEIVLSPGVERRQPGMLDRRMNNTQERRTRAAA